MGREYKCGLMEPDMKVRREFIYFIRFMEIKSSTWSREVHSRRWRCL
jgi:hypothetical protein